MKQSVSQPNIYQKCIVPLSSSFPFVIIHFPCLACFIQRTLTKLIVFPTQVIYFDFSNSINSPGLKIRNLIFCDPRISSYQTMLVLPASHFYFSYFFISMATMILRPHNSEVVSQSAHQFRHPISLSKIHCTHDITL